VNEVYIEEFIEALEEVFGETERGLTLNMRSGKRYGDLYIYIVKRELPLWFEREIAREYVCYMTVIQKFFKPAPQLIMGESPMKTCIVVPQLIMGESPMKTCIVVGQFAFMSPSEVYGRTVRREFSITPQSI